VNIPITTYYADIYDTIYPGTLLGDIDFYRRKAVESGGPVLEHDGDELVVEARRRSRGRCSSRWPGRA
jgi:hypothetical protein